MKLVLCSIYDSAVQTYSPPFCVRGIGLAYRDFRFEVRNKDSRISKSAGDYALFVLGEFDDEACSFTLLDAPRRMMTGLDALKEDPINEG